jgi:hypothetical protein
MSLPALMAAFLVDSQISGGWFRQTAAELASE